MLTRTWDIRDYRFDYCVYRSVDLDRSVEAVRELFRPEVLVINVGSVVFASAVMRAAGTIPIVVYFHNQPVLPLLQRPEFRANLLMAVAPHLATAVADLGCSATIVAPFIESDSYLPPSSRRVILFVNPIEQKGANVAWALAERCPDLPFVFLKAWQLGRRASNELRARSRHLSNVRVRNAERDPARIYSDARILLAPYPSAEGYPRVIAEAQALGIPVVATDAPNLRFAAGDGALFVNEQAPIARWEEALRELWDDTRVYEKHANAARQHATRDEVDPQYVVTQFENAMMEALANKTLGPSCGVGTGS